MANRYVPPVPDFDFIVPRLAVGSRINETGLRFTRRRGVTHLVAADTHPDPAAAASWGLTVIAHPFDDDFQDKPARLLLDIADDAVRTLLQPDAVLLLTCGAGMHRAPMMAQLVLRLMGLEPDEAHDLIRTRRTGAGVPQAYLDSVERAVRQWSGPRLPRPALPGENA